jgi:hypothetical protein
MLNLHEQRPMSTGGSTLVTSKREFQSGSELRVLTIDVAEIMNSVLDPSMTLIKMDIEGSEYQVLRRMVSHRKFKEFGPIFVEFHERKMVGGSLERLRLTGSFWRHGLSTRRIIEWF